MEADPILTTNYAFTFRAFPFFFFLFHEALYTMLFDKLQIIYHTHMIKSTVPFIESFKTTAWEITTFITEADKPFT